MYIYAIYIHSGCVVEKKQHRARPSNRRDVIKFPHQHIGPAGRYDRRDMLYPSPAPRAASFVYSLTHTVQPPPPITSSHATDRPTDARPP